MTLNLQELINSTNKTTKNSIIVNKPVFYAILIFNPKFIQDDTLSFYIICIYDLNIFSKIHKVLTCLTNIECNKQLLKKIFLVSVVKFFPATMYNSRKISSKFKIITFPGYIKENTLPQLFKLFTILLICKTKREPDISCNSQHFPTIC